MINQDEEGVEDLAENTTVIAVNIASLAAVDSNSLLNRPPPNIARTPSNRSANDTRESVLKVSACIKKRLRFCFLPNY